VGGVVAALRERPQVAEVARLLDHDLGLTERVSTALELESHAPLSASVGRVGLPALIDAEAAAAVSPSLGSARAVLARPTSTHRAASALPTRRIAALRSLRLTRAVVHVTRLVGR
jgi:hypothetical protein